MEGDYTYDEPSGAWYTGDPSQEENWVYDPPGQAGNADWMNFEPDGQGGWTGYDYGEEPNADAPTFSTQYWNGQPPNQDQQDQAVLDYVSSWAPGFEAPNYNWNPTMDPEGGYSDWGSYGDQTSAPPPGAGSGKPPEIPAGAGPKPLTPAQQTIRDQQAALDQAIRDIKRDNAARFAEEQRQANLREQGLNTRAEQTAQVQREQIQAGERNARLQAQNAGEQTMAAREANVAKQALAERELASKLTLTEQDRQDKEKQQRLALATALLQLGTGPNGPANRRMALQILAGLGVQGVQGAQPGATEGPNIIPPILWDAMPPAAKKLVLDAWQAQGGDPKDFLFGIDQQRPQQGPANAGMSAPRVRYAGVA